MGRLANRYGLELELSSLRMPSIGWSFADSGRFGRSLHGAHTCVWSLRIRDLALCAGVS